MNQDELSALVGASHECWSTLRSSGRAWEDRLVTRQARTARQAQSERSSRASRLPELRGVSAIERNQQWRLWRGGLLLVRSEYVIGREVVTVVGQGPRWWRWSPTLGAASGGGGNRPVDLLLGPVAALFDGAALLQNLEVVQQASGTVAGRDAVVLRTRPAASRPRERSAFREVGPGADEYQLSIDAERGVLLATTAYFQGHAFRTVETSEIAYDEELPPNLFSPNAPAGERFVPPRPSQRLTLEELAAEVPFAVVVPDPALSSVAPHIAHFEADRRGPERAVITWPVVEQSVRGQLRVVISSDFVPGSDATVWERQSDLETSEERHGAVARRRVRARLGSTAVEVESNVVSLARLIAVTRSLARVSPAGSSAARGSLRALPPV
ncbi:MAG: hypothetical protein JWM85_2665 [Acidimicrobiaceae bacterium]|nr:hypothetical protein [Acidimicrobiaceae bacterium]